MLKTDVIIELYLDIQDIRYRSGELNNKLRYNNLSRYLITTHKTTWRDLSNHSITKTINYMVAVAMGRQVVMLDFTIKDYVPEVGEEEEKVLIALITELVQLSESKEESNG